MSLRPAHLGYAYQDLLTAIRLVDVALGRAPKVTVDTKLFGEDRFDDITTEWRSAAGRDGVAVVIEPAGAGSAGSAEPAE